MFHFRPLRSCKELPSPVVLACRIVELVSKAECGDMLIAGWLTPCFVNCLKTTKKTRMKKSTTRKRMKTKEKGIRNEDRSALQPSA